MNVSAAQTSLERFLEVKRAAEERFKQAAVAKTNSVSPAKESFFDIIKNSGKKVDNNLSDKPIIVEQKAPVARKSSSSTSQGLMSVYGVNRYLNKNLSESPAREELLKARHLGKLFDAVA